MRSGDRGIVIMEQVFHVDGMTCGSCVAKVQGALEKLPEVGSAKVELSEGNVTLETERMIEPEVIQKTVAAVGSYSYSDEASEKELAPLPSIGHQEVAGKSFLETYKPLLLIVLFVAGTPAIIQMGDSWSWMLWMRHFMAGFFLTFSFFKLLNIRGFASSYAMYDLLAAKWKPWGFIYPFIELALGLAYLINYEPQLTNWVTVAVLGFSSIGVIQSNLSRRKIKCACLGDVFDLPMSTVTVIEDLTMVAMAAFMLIK